MNNQKISVIIPTYNRPRFLAQAVHSVLAQTHPVFEIIIVDDCSSLEHRPAISAVGRLDERVRFHYFDENRGVSAARDYGIDKSTGDYILFLDDDDLLHPKMVQSCLDKFNGSPDTDVVACWHEVFYDQFPADSLNADDEKLPENLRNTLYIQKYVSFPSIEERPFSALLQICLQVSSCLIKKEAINGLRFPEELQRD